MTEEEKVVRCEIRGIGWMRCRSSVVMFQTQLDACLVLADMICTVSHDLVALSTQGGNYGSPTEPDCTVYCTDKKSHTIKSLHNSDRIEKDSL
jgi:hypothetical protein